MALGTLTLAQLRLASQQRADMVNSGFVTDAEWNSYINQSYYELYDLLVQKYGDDYFVQTPYQFQTDGINGTYALPADFYKLLGVDLQLGDSTTGWVTVKPFNFAERNRYAVPNFQSFYGVTNLRYRVRGNQIWFTPLPSGGQRFQLFYVPRLTELVSDSDVADGVDGWLEYVICDAAIKAGQKEETDVSVLLAQKAALTARIESASENRNAGDPFTVQDTQNTGIWPDGNGGLFGGGG